jgi:hypothetical protein
MPAPQLICTAFPENTVPSNLSTVAPVTSGLTWAFTSRTCMRRAGLLLPVGLPDQLVEPLEEELLASAGPGRIAQGGRVFADLAVLPGRWASPPRRSRKTVKAGQWRSTQRPIPGYSSSAVYQ